MICSLELLLTLSIMVTATSPYDSELCELNLFLCILMNVHCLHNMPHFRFCEDSGKAFEFLNVLFVSAS